MIMDGASWTSLSMLEKNNIYNEREQELILGLDIFFLNEVNGTRKCGRVSVNLCRVSLVGLVLL